MNIKFAALAYSDSNCVYLSNDFYSREVVGRIV